MSFRDQYFWHIVWGSLIFLFLLCLFAVYMNRRENRMFAARAQEELPIMPDNLPTHIKSDPL